MLDTSIPPPADLDPATGQAKPGLRRALSELRFLNNPKNQRAATRLQVWQAALPLRPDAAPLQLSSSDEVGDFTLACARQAAVRGHNVRKLMSAGFDRSQSRSVPIRYLQRAVDITRRRRFRADARVRLDARAAQQAAARHQRDDVAELRAGRPKRVSSNFALGALTSSTQLSYTTAGTSGGRSIKAGYSKGFDTTCGCAQVCCATARQPAPSCGRTPQLASQLPC